MVIDTSALVAILTGEPESRKFIEVIEATEARLISAATFVEISMVIESRHGAEGSRALDLFLARAEVEVAHVDIEQAQGARRAQCRLFGRGAGAGLLGWVALQ